MYDAVESDDVLDRVLQLFVSLGYPKQGVDWISQRRGWVILVLAVIAWAVLLVGGYLAFQALQFIVDPAAH